jgi:hypothetical protein
MQFVAVKFNPKHSRTYTYQWDGPPVRPGQRVKVPDNSGDGWKAVEVVSVSSVKPAFDCKAILGLFDGADADAKILAAGDDRGKVVSAKAAKPKPATSDLFS